ncbi:hypothetical protein N0V88_006763 [Collariella sp. IMI 366227]|nr:hypothetical protein N0V88_006763 [Collariella sp. IMI 366227]
MSNMFASRKGPILIVAGVLGGIFYATYGGKQQPRPRATSDTSSRIPMSETLQSVAGTGGERAHGHKDGEGLRQFDSKDTRLASANPTADSKRNLQKSQGGVE